MHALAGREQRGHPEVDAGHSTSLVGGRGCLYFTREVSEPAIALAFHGNGFDLPAHWSVFVYADVTDALQVDTASAAAAGVPSRPIGGIP